MTGDRDANGPPPAVKRPADPGARRLLAAAALAAVVVALYLPVFSSGFLNWDDQGYVTKNPRVLRGLSGEGAAWALTTATVGNWEPLVWLSHMLAVDLFGLRPGAHHLVNVALHAVSAALLFLALEGMTGAAAPAALTALLFAVHPQNVEVVAWVSARKDALAGLFFVLTLLAYLRYVRRPSLARYLMVAAATGLALASKPVAVALPVALLSVDFWPLGRLRGAGKPGGSTATALVIEKVPLLLAAFVCGVWTLINQWRSDAIVVDRPFGLTLANATVAAATALGRAVWPSGYSPLYRLPDAIPAWQWAAAALLLAAITFLAVRLCSRRPWLAAGWLWHVAVLLPASGVVPVGYQAWADRYAYLPSIGIFAALAWELRGLVARFPRRGFVVAAAAVATLLLASVTRHSLGYWRDSESLFRRALAVDPGNARAHLALGNVYGGRGRHAAALAEFEAAARLDPLTEGLAGNLGYEYTLVGRFEEALLWLDMAAAAAPGDDGARREAAAARARVERAKARARAPGAP